jgi:hypothetical protein
MGEQNIFMELVGIIIAGFTVEDDLWGLIRTGACTRTN